MKVFGIACGRKNGNSETLLKEAFMAIEEECGAECEYIRLQDAQIRACQGCESCIRAHLAGNWEFRCVHKKEEDHLFFIEQHFREADAIIISTPIYNLQPSGLLIRLFNKLHGTGDYRELVRDGADPKPKLGACIAVGGTDWTNFGTAYASMATSEFCGTFDNIVDKMLVQNCAAPGSVLIDDAVVNRAHQLGSNVARALLSGQKSGVYAGEDGVCPVCHGSLLEYRNGDLWCPMCEIKGETSIDENGKLKVFFSEETVSHARFKPYGLKLHDENILKSHARFGENAGLVKEKQKKYADYKEPLELPEIK